MDQINIPLEGQMDYETKQADARQQLLNAGFTQTGPNTFLGDKFTAMVTDRPGMTDGEAFALGLRGRIPPENPDDFRGVVTSFRLISPAGGTDGLREKDPAAP